MDLLERWLEERERATTDTQEATQEAAQKAREDLRWRLMYALESIAPEDQAESLPTPTGGDLSGG